MKTRALKLPLLMALIAAVAMAPTAVADDPLTPTLPIGLDAVLEEAEEVLPDDSDPAEDDGTSDDPAEDDGTSDDPATPLDDLPPVIEPFQPVIEPLRGQADEALAELLPPLPVEDAQTPREEGGATPTDSTTTGSDVHVIGNDVDSSMLAAGAFTALALGLLVTAAKHGGLSRFLPLGLAGLFSRFHGSTILDHPRRAELHALVCRDPGATVPELVAATGLSRNTVLHHLQMMEKQGLIVSSRNGRNVHWYENGGRYGRQHKAAYAVLRDDRSRDVARFVLTHPGSAQTHVAEALGLAPSVVSWHMQRLEEAELVHRRSVGRSMQCFPQELLPGLVG